MKRPPHSNIRWWIAGLLCLSTALNYLDRQVLSILAGTIQKELGLSEIDYSRITSAFLVSYTVMYAVSGRLLDRFGTRIGLAVSVVAWSLANMLHGFARTAHHLMACRFLLGVGESANWPAAVKAVAEWFPMRERALAVSIFNSGGSIGAAIAAPVVAGLALAFGWRAAFVITGALGLAWLVGWLWLYFVPNEHPKVSDAERKIVLDRQSGPADTAPSCSIRKLLSMKETWGCIAARALIDPVTYFLIFWIPKYLQQDQGFTLAALGTYAWIPYAALAAGTIVGGVIPHRLIQRGWKVDRARKSVMLAASILIPVCYAVLTNPGGPVIAMLAITGCMFGHGAWGNVTIPAEVFPKSVVATVSGLGGTIGGIAGIATQLAIGWLVQNVSFLPVFAGCASMYLLALLLVHRLAGELGRVRDIAP